VLERVVIEVIAYLIDVPEDLLAGLIEDGYISECSKHGYEVTGGIQPEQLEERLEWLAGPFLEGWEVKH
jgi:hypothetical protein